ncbi:conserved hypothetical protein [Burkholderia sp. 8Y]|uniref:hypothetical protein n=1 Tax=Burkholderia sp. 8Y TaxID=2653133 RepID=UPI0012F1A7B8|nr:hypothetical protein [Burkholderia sp. 8Y]VXB34082.1 conserved hypothetical protein [Burkholderia sp. 8Y]
MTDSKKEIERRLSVLQGLQLSGVNRAADMLTLAFGAQRPVTNFRGVVKHVGEWALHIQSAWRLEQMGRVAATEVDLRRGDDEARATVHRLQRLLLEPDFPIVESVTANEAGGVSLSLSGDLNLTVVPDAVEEDEDWRFFASGVGRRTWSSKVARLLQSLLAEEKASMSSSPTAL